MAGGAARAARGGSGQGPGAAELAGGSLTPSAMLIHRRRNARYPAICVPAGPLTDPNGCASKRLAVRPWQYHRSAEYPPDNLVVMAAIRNSNGLNDS